MNEATTLADQGLALGALAQIIAAFGHLPAACFTLSDVYPDRVQISVHDSLTHFEQWRTALGIPAAAVDYGTLPASMDLTVFGSFAGAEIKLCGYAPLLPVPIAAAAGGAA
jgi:hypothetical protein